MANEEVEVCCCSHEHHKDCAWHKKYLEDPEAAHNIHSNKECKCKESKRKGQDHIKTCDAYKNFKRIMTEIYQKKEEADDEFGDGGDFEEEFEDSDDTNYLFDP